MKGKLDKAVTRIAIMTFLSPSRFLNPHPHVALPHFVSLLFQAPTEMDSNQAKKSFPKASVPQQALMQMTDPKRLQKSDPPLSLTAFVYFSGHFCD